jgi:hypothetical protein
MIYLAVLEYNPTLSGLNQYRPDFNTTREGRSPRLLQKWIFDYLKRYRIKYGKDLVEVTADGDTFILKGIRIQPGYLNKQIDSLTGRVSRTLRSQINEFPTQQITSASQERYQELETSLDRIVNAFALRDLYYKSKETQSVYSKRFALPEFDGTREQLMNNLTTLVDIENHGRVRTDQARCELLMKLFAKIGLNLEGEKVVKALSIPPENMQRMYLCGILVSEEILDRKACKSPNLEEFVSFTRQYGKDIDCIVMTDEYVFARNDTLELTLNWLATYYRSFADQELESVSQ